MIISPEVLALSDSFFRDTVENNEVFIVKWTFPEAAFPDLSLGRAERDYRLAEKTLETARGMRSKGVSHNDEMVLRILESYCGYIQKNYLNWWLRFDLNHCYRTLPTMADKLVSLPVATPADRDFYLEVLSNFAPFVHDALQKMQDQAKRYVRLPKRGVRLALSALRTARDTLAGADRFDGCATPLGAVMSALGELEAWLEHDYLPQCPDAIGMGQYPGGAEMYMREVDTYISCAEDPAKIMQVGLDELARTEGEMLSIAREMGYEGTLREVMDRIDADPAYRFSTPEEMQQTLTGYLNDMRPHMARYFSRMPKADCAVARINPADEATSSWGYYNVPVDSDVGVYYYSAAELDKRSQIRMNAVVLHELLPGHHYQMNLVLEDETLPEIVHHHYNTAYADGWAEYASGLGRELGIYGPIQDFGRLSWDSFLCCRLVVDTGLNALGWTFDDARQFLREHTMFTDFEISTELLRYTCGMPAQALAYKWGSLHFNRMRRRAEEALGDAFDIRRYHDEVLAFGAIPLDVLEHHFQWYLANERG